MSNGLCRPVAASLAGDSFDDVVLPHLDAACRLARHLMRNQHDAETPFRRRRCVPSDTSAPSAAGTGVHGF